MEGPSAFRCTGFKSHLFVAGEFAGIVEARSSLHLVDGNREVIQRGALVVAVGHDDCVHRSSWSFHGQDHFISMTGDGDPPFTNTFDVSVEPVCR
jgi:hypothetical protein